MKTKAIMLLVIGSAIHSIGVAGSVGSLAEPKMVEKATPKIEWIEIKTKTKIIESYNPKLDWVGYEYETWKNGVKKYKAEKHYIKIKEVKKIKMTNKTSKTFTAYITQYSRADSCHNVVKGKCLMASGKPVYEGAVACPRWLKLGSKVKIQGKIYTCEDRYAKWIDKKRGLPTIDIFVNSDPKGRLKLKVEVL